MLASALRSTLLPGPAVVLGCIGFNTGQMKSLQDMNEPPV